MKLLYITNGINGPGGLERVLSVKVSALADMEDVEVGIVALNGNHQHPFYHFSPKIKTWSITVIGNPLQYIYAYITGIRKAVREFRPDIISVCDDGLKGFFIPRVLGRKIPIIYERHVSKLIEANGKPGFGTQLKWKLMELLARDFDRFVVLTKGNLQEWKSLKNTVVIPNPLPFQSNQITDYSQKVMVCVGKISTQKGQDILLKIWPQIFQKFPDWELHWYGTENLEVLDTHNLPKGIRHFPPTQDIENAYLSASVYVLPSRFEGFGMVLIEAMEFGLPCVAFDCDYGPGDIIKHNKDGILVTQANTEELQLGLETLMKSVDLRKKLGEAAKQSVKKYNVDEIMHLWEKLFNQLVK